MNLLFDTIRILPTRWARRSACYHPHNRQSLCKLPSHYLGIGRGAASLQRGDDPRYHFSDPFLLPLLAAGWLEPLERQCYHGTAMPDEPRLNSDSAHPSGRTDLPVALAEANRTLLSPASASESPPSADSYSSPIVMSPSVVLATAVPRRPTGSGRRCSSIESFQPFERWLLVAVCVGIFGLLGVARWLTPNEAGVGTHRALGFPPCGAIAMWGIPCPSCGMTTSWAWFTRGHFDKAWSSNPGGVMLAVFVLVMATWMGISGILNRWWPVPCQPNYVLASAAVVVGVTLVQWLYRVWPDGL